MYGPRTLDPGREGDLSVRSLRAYQRASADFVEFCELEHSAPHQAEEWDDLIIEWSVARNVRASQLRGLLAAVEFLFPRYKTELRWSRQRLNTLLRITPPKHAQLPGRELSPLFAAHLSSKG